MSETNTSASSEMSKEDRASIDPHKAKQLVATIACNVENDNLDDASFRAFVRNSLPVALGPKVISDYIR